MVAAVVALSDGDIATYAGLVFLLGVLFGMTLARVG